MDLSNNEIVHIKKDEVEYLQFKRLLKYDEIIHAYSLNMLDFKKHNDNNVPMQYDKFLRKLGLSLNSLIKPSQNHTDNILTVYSKQKDNEPDIYLDYLNDVDGTVTDKSGITIATTNADCILLLFYDPIKKVIANVHSGWKGTFKKIASKTVKILAENYGCNPKDIIVCICPSIRVCHFEVDEEVKKECESIFEYTNKINEIIKFR